MNHYIFFLLLIIPFVVIPDAHAEIEKFKNYELEYVSTNPDGSENKIFRTTPERLATWNGWADYVHTDTADSICIETAYGSVCVDKNTCGFSYFNQGYIDEGEAALFTDSIIPLQSTDQITWNQVNQIVNAACVASWDSNTQTLKATKTHSVGIMEYRYIFVDSSWKTELYVHNTSGLNDRYFGFSQSVDLNRDTVHYGGSQRNLDNYDGQSFNRTWIENNEGKVLDFLNGQQFDFDIAFDNLGAVSVEDTGANKSKLVFSFTHDTSILADGVELTLDPTFSATTINEDGMLVDEDGSGTCGDTVSSSSTSGTILFVGSKSGSGNCNRAYVEWDVSGWDSSWTATSINFIFNVVSAHDTDELLDLTHMSNQPSVTADSTILTDIGDGDEYVSSHTSVSTTGDKDITLLAAAVTNWNTDVDVGGNTWFAMGIKGDTETDAGNDRFQIAADEHANQDMELEVEYTTVVTFPPDAVIDLTISNVAIASMDLSWTEPAITNGTCQGYQINYTTPWGDPNTLITNDTESCATSYSVTSLTPSSQYSFRVSVWDPWNGNFTGNIANGTTLGSAVSFGNLTLNQTNTNTVDMLFERIDVNDTHTFLNVTYSDSFDLACDLDFELAGFNQTYSNLDNVTVNSAYVESTFIFVNQTNDIVTVHCWDQTTGYDGQYVLQWSDFPLLDQINNFRNGTYGTDGEFAAMDLITILVIVGSMLGFNRRNESVGIIFSVAFIGFVAFLGIVEWPTVLTGIIAVIVVITVTSTRKD